MADTIDFQPYLDSIRYHYEEWWKLYTLTDIEGKQRDRLQDRQHTPFDFGLMVRSVVKEEVLQQENSQKTERRPVLEGLRKSLTEARHVLLIGRPGSGKSTALARLLLEEAQNYPENEIGKIPVLVELRYYQTSILDLIRDFFKRHELLLASQNVESMLLQNRLLLLVDGLNELSSDAARQDVIQLLNYRQVPMLFTTRDLSLGGDFGIEKQWVMHLLTESQMKEFMEAHLSADQADELWQQLKDRTRQLAETPLLLWMLCELFKQVQEIPRNLGEVFQVFTRSYEESSIRKYEVAALKGDVQPLSDRRLWFPALKHLAYTLMQGETPVDFRTVISREEAERELKAFFSEEPHPAKTARDCLDDLLKHHLLQVHSPGQIEFRHQLFQEYYAAEWLLEKLDEFTDEQLKCYFLNYLKWTEAIILMLGFIKDHAKIIRVVELALEVDGIMGERLSKGLNFNFQKYPRKLSITLDHFHRLKLKIGEYVQGYPRTCVELQKWSANPFIVTGISKNSELPELLESLENPEFSIKIHAAKILGEMGNHEAESRLLKNLSNKDTNIRQQTAGNQIGTQRLLPEDSQLTGDRPESLTQSNSMHSTNSVERSGYDSES